MLSFVVYIIQHLGLYHRLYHPAFLYHPTFQHLAAKFAAVL